MDEKVGMQDGITHHLNKMYQDWVLDYASYVILERAVPHIGDGFKPVQRRILHSMKRMDDGRFNKVANIVGHTMQFHPHGDASIKDALVQLGQKELLIDCQGNWGNILTGDDAAAGRYIQLGEQVAWAGELPERRIPVHGQAGEQVAVGEPGKGHLRRQGIGTPVRDLLPRGLSPGSGNQRPRQQEQGQKYTK